MTTPATALGDPASPAPLYARPTQSGREQTVSYADLMKPDEDWRNLPNAADRRKIQNRLAQRAYRRSLKERNEEIKRLKKQVEKLEETQAQGELATPPGEREPDANDAGPSGSLASSGTTTNHETVHSATASVISESDWMGDYLGIWPHTPPRSDHDSFAGLSHGQVKAWDSGFPSMDAAADRLLQPIPERSWGQHAGPSTETVRSASVSCCPQHHGEACNSGSKSSSNGSSTGNGNNDTFAYPSMSLGPDVMRHTRGHTMDTTGSDSASQAAGSPTLKPFSFGNTTPKLRPVTSRLQPRRNNDGYNDDGSSGKTSPFSNQPRLQMETSTSSSSYNEGGHPASASSHRSPTSAPSWCCYKSGGGHHAADMTSGFSVRGGPHAHAGKEHERQRTSIQPLDMDSLYTQGQLLHHGLVVQPSECGDGVTIRLQPTAANARASLVAFMIQHDPSPLGGNQACRMDHDGHH
ncbi:hypothetical protein C8A00DRAFT_33299 [Chaetomidium leptoderma]|uniref:BZIP domain-containing protein n=1 Tax=Chaetomidium leptoderma TaxID=669021 RepID=A0AAN6ZWZ2_9PEZI|nr:hypothetical protein C8A00DRAFT_33299 [Chaetomidium leptoderma]